MYICTYKEIYNVPYFVTDDVHRTNFHIQSFGTLLCEEIVKIPVFFCNFGNLPTPYPRNGKIPGVGIFLSVKIPMGSL